MVKCKRDRLTEFNRGNILEAARTLFEEKGAAQTTMDDIAKRADYSKSTIYVYFKSKDEIYFHIVRESMELLRDRFRSVLGAHEDAESAFYAVCGELAGFQREYPLYFDSIQGEIGVGEVDFEQYPVLRDIYMVGEEINEAISAMLRRGMDAHLFRGDINPVPTIFMLWASLCGIIKMAQQKEAYLRSKQGISREEFLCDCFGTLLRALKAGEV